MTAVPSLIARYEPQTIRMGNYQAQGQLDYRVLHGQTLKLISPMELAVIRELERKKEEREFQVAMGRRKEEAGASLRDVAKKYGLE
jgi:hypothetical protein